MKKKRKKVETYSLYEIRAALRKWCGIRIETDGFKTTWHNFKWDLKDVRARNN